MKTIILFVVYIYGIIAALFILAAALPVIVFAVALTGLCMVLKSVLWADRARRAGKGK